MRKLIAGLLFCAAILSCTACGGKVNEVGVLEVKSTIYTSGEINDGINAVLDYFQKEFRGCTLVALQYVGDDRNSDFVSYAQRIGSDEVMVFTSTFDVDESGGDGSLNPNTSYEGWLWILARTPDGKWEHVDHGY